MWPPEELAPWAGRNVFGVTGGRGAIGSRLVEALTTLGASRIVSIGRSPAPHPQVSDRIEERVGDILDPAFLAASLEGVDIVYHLAGNSHAGRCASSPLDCFRANALGTAVTAEACRLAGVSHVLYASTGHVYDKALPPPAREDFRTNPISPYAASKRAGEAYLQGVASLGWFRCHIMRLCNVYGGAPDPETVLGRALSQAARGGPIELYNLGAMRDFMHVDDAVEGMLRLASTAATGEAAEVVNVSPGEPGGIAEAAERVASLAEADLGHPVQVLASNPSVEDVFYLDSGRLRAITGWIPSTALDRGLEAVWKEHCVSHGKEKS